MPNELAAGFDVTDPYLSQSVSPSTASGAADRRRLAQRRDNRGLACRPGQPQRVSPGVRAGRL